VYFVSKETRKHAVLRACEWKFKEQRAKMWENIAGRKDTLAPLVLTLRGERPRRPRRSDASDRIYGHDTIVMLSV